MPKKNINTILTIVIIAAAMFFVSKQNYFVKNIEIRVVSAPILPKAKPAEQQIYDINKLMAQQQDEPKGPVTDLASVYADYPKERAGENMIEAWGKVSPGDKAKFTKGLAEEIERLKAALKTNPDDSKAKSRLVISENLKKLALNNFNIKFKEKE